jgi:hypothetical protein
MLIIETLVAILAIILVLNIHKHHWYPDRYLPNGQGDVMCSCILCDRKKLMLHSEFIQWLKDEGLLHIPTIRREVRYENITI